MDDLLPLINRLQEMFAKAGLDTVDLPQIAVVGSQSAGKSSVLENIVGRSFLPRGSGIVTRRPLVLQLVTSTDGREYAVFGHCPDKEWSDFDQVQQEIDDETDRLCGDSKGVDKKPIILKYYSPRVVNLTLIDLPGMTRYATGSQDANISSQIKNLIMEYIKSPNCLILAVSPANVDLANSDALALAAEVDPTFERTIGVLTKLDLMDEGTDAMDIFQGQVHKMKRPFIGVVNRSQANINNDMSMQDSRQRENEFFRTHPVYGKLANRLGTEHLVETLRKELIKHIQGNLPEVKMRIKEQLMDLENQYADRFGPVPEFLGTSESTVVPRIETIRAVTVFADSITKVFDGRQDQLEMTYTTGAARIKVAFENFNEALGTLRNIDAAVTNDGLKIAIANAQGLRCDVFLSSWTFQTMVSKVIQLLEKPCLRSFDQVYTELDAIVNDAMDVFTSHSDMGNVPKALGAHIVQQALVILKGLRYPLQSYIRDMISRENAYVNTDHPDFVHPPEEFAVAYEETTEVVEVGLEERLDDQDIVVHEGHVYKKSHYNNWSLRYFRLVGGVLQYSSNEEGKARPTQTLSLDDVVVEECDLRPHAKLLPDVEDVNERSILLRRVDGGVMYKKYKTLVFLATDADDYQLWRNALRRATSKNDLPKKVLACDDEAETSDNVSTMTNRKLHPSPFDDVVVNMQAIPEHIVSHAGIVTVHPEEIDALRSSLQRYYDVVRVNVGDALPKVITYHLINKFKDILATQLMSHFTSEETLAIVDGYFEEKLHLDAIAKKDLFEKIICVRETILKLKL